MTVSKKICTAFLLIVLVAAGGRVLAQQPDSLSQARQIVASGIGSIVNDDVAHARDDAIADALRTGLEQAVGMIVESETLVDNYQLIEDNIFSKTRGYVQTYKVIREGKRDAQLYEVTIQALVKIADLKNDLDGIATLMRRKNMPRIMMIIEEQNVGEGAGTLHYFDVDMNVAETEIMDLMMAKGFSFVDPVTVKANIERDQAAAILEGDNSLAASLGRSLGAEVVLTGKAVATAQEVEVFGSRQRSQQAALTVRAIRSDTGEIIAVASAQGAFPHINDVVGGTKAIQRACGTLTGDLVNKILARWSSDVSSGTKLTLTINGITGFDMLSNFKSAVTYHVRGMESLVQRSWNGSIAVFEVTMKGSSEDLARRLSNQEIGGVLVKVTGMTQNSVTITLSE
ncbi:hypothetical protein JXO52_12195 [bacterium]|nr:hypothetical protein [bacterium]